MPSLAGPSRSSRSQITLGSTRLVERRRERSTITLNMSSRMGSPEVRVRDRTRRCAPERALQDISCGSNVKEAYARDPRALPLIRFASSREGVEQFHAGRRVVRAISGDNGEVVYQR